MKTKILLMAILIIALASCKKKDETSTPDPTPTPIPNPTGNPRIGFEKTFGTSGGIEEGRYVIQTPDGGFLVAGDSLRKTDANGVIVFTKDIAANSVMPTSDGNYIIAGQYSYNYFKVDPSGNILWTKTTSVTLDFIYQTSDGGFIACGEDLVIKTDASGIITWSQLLGTSGMNDYFNAHEVRQTNDGGYVVVGKQVTGSTWDSQFDIYKLSSSGTILWIKEFGATTYSDEGYSVKATSDGGCIAAGMTGSGWYDMYLIKLDVNGNTSWSATYGGSSTSENASYVQLTSDGGYVLVGTTDLDGNGNTFNVYVVKTNSSGVKTWDENYGGTGRDYGYCIQQTSDGGYIVAGRYDYASTGGKRDVYLLKLKY